MTSTDVKNFRSDFQNAVTELQKKYGVNLGVTLPLRAVTLKVIHR